MVFSSPVFIFLFLPVVLALVFVAGRKFRNVVLLLASLFFYAWGEGEFVALMLLSVVINYACGRWIHRAQNQGRDTEGIVENPPAAKWALVVAITGNLGLLGFFKYANFFADQINAVALAIGMNPLHLEPVHLPIGISFFTFQALSYIVDVYRRDTEPQYNIVNLALYISLFPQLIAGPIVRYHDIAKQLLHRSMSVPMFARGVRRFIMGLSKKVLIANTLAVAADGIFSMAAQDVSAPLAWLGIAAFTLQIYFDFSGYSDMAIGLGLMLGFEFLENFNYPYISKSIREFWRRWHISLSTWFRDYLYIPMGGGRVGPLKVYRNLLVVFLLTGLWHGASWSFIVWGLFHGFFILLERVWLGNALKRLGAIVAHIYVLLVVTVGWVFFRAETLTDGLRYLKNMFTFGANGHISNEAMVLYVTPKIIMALIVGIILSTPIWPWFLERYRMLSAESTNGRRIVMNTVYVGTQVCLLCVLIVCFLMLASGTYNPFIYYRF